MFDNNCYSTKLIVRGSFLKKNIDFFKSKISKKTKIIAVVKANAYGYGDIGVSNKLIENGVDYLAVADFEEGVRIRNNNINLPIMILYPSKNNLRIIVENSLEPTIYNEFMLNALLKIETQKIKIHIKIDSGMHRYGITKEQVPVFIKKIKKSKHIVIGSVFSHLSSHKKEHHKYSLSQINYFNKIKNIFLKEFTYKIDTHILSSFGVINFPKQSDSMVRIGFGLYNGIFNNKLNHVGELCSHITQIQNLNKGDSVGYNRSFIALKKMKIAVLPLGYADGLQRSWGNGKLKFLYKKTLVPVLGEISMDSCIIDVSNINKVKEGDKLVLFGNKRSIFSLAQELDTIPYEITAGLSKRIKRIFI